MSHDEPPPAATVRRRTVLLCSAAAIAAIGVAAAAVLPGGRRHPAAVAASPASAPSVPIAPSAGVPAGPAATNVPVTAADGTTVTDVRRILGSWSTVELDGQNVRAVRGSADRPLGVKFERYDGELRWGGNDLLNYHSGTFSVSKDGRFQANPGASTLVGSIGDRELYLRNPEAVQQATEARLVAATPVDPPRLLLLAGGKLIGVYTPAAT